MTRTNKYFVTGFVVIKTFVIGQPGKPNLQPFNTDITITGVSDDTPAAGLIQLIKTEATKAIVAEWKQPVDEKNISFANISLIDSFEETEAQA